MRNKNAFKCALSGCAVLTLLITAMNVDVAARKPSDPPAIHATPPAPVFTDDERVAELRARRERVADKIGNSSILVMLSAEPRVYTNDVDFEFRQENNLYYLTNLNQQGATLVLLPGIASTREILFLPRRSPARETWTGRMYSAEDARRISGVGEIWDAKEFEPFMRAMRSRRAYRPQSDGLLLSDKPPTTPEQAAASQSQASAPPSQAVPTDTAKTGFETLFAAMSKGEASLYLSLPGGGDNREYRQEQELAATWARAATGLNVKSAWGIFSDMRQIKSANELKLMQHAVDISIEGHGRAQAIASRAQWEYEVEAEIDYTYKRRNAENWGYPNIVGCGPNGTTLHYVESQGRIRPGDLILIDAGAEYGHYTADVTRTFPMNGKFSKEQAEIYNIVLAAQEASFRVVRPGGTLMENNNAAVEVIKDGLLKLGLITNKNSNQHRTWFMHGTSHWLGMNVHDVGSFTAKFEPGMVFTVEPGIYIRPDALDNLPKTPENEKFIAAVRPAFEKYKSIAVRIEDDLVVTADGYRNMSAALPRTIGDIESFIERAQREVRAGAVTKDFYTPPFVASWFSIRDGLNRY